MTYEEWKAKYKAAADNMVAANEEFMKVAAKDIEEIEDIESVDEDAMQEYVLGIAMSTQLKTTKLQQKYGA